MSDPGVLVCQEPKLLTSTVPFFIRRKGLTTFHINRSVFQSQGQSDVPQSINKRSGSVKSVDFLKSVQSKAVSQAMMLTQRRWLELLQPQLSNDKLSPLTLRGP